MGARGTSGPQKKHEGTGEWSAEKTVSEGTGRQEEAKASARIQPNQAYKNRPGSQPGKQARNRKRAEAELIPGRGKKSWRGRDLPNLQLIVRLLGAS